MMRLAETEYRVLNLVWAEEGITAKNLAEALRHSIGWSKTTTYTIPLHPKGLYPQRRAQVPLLFPGVPGLGGRTGG